MSSRMWRAPMVKSVLILLALSQQVCSTCYYPDGSPATDNIYVPCSGSAFSSCCIPGEGDVCLSNGLCYWQGEQYLYRASCTDQTWKSDACAKYCNTISPSTWEQLVSCGGTKYCCGSDSNCCSHSNLVFDIGTPSVVNAYSASGTAPGSKPTTYSNPLITATTDGAKSGATSPAGSSSGNSSGNASSSVGKGAIIGIAAGVIAFLILAGLGLLAFFCLRRRKNNAPTNTSMVNLMDMPNSSNANSAVSSAVEKPQSFPQNFQQNFQQNSPQSPTVWEAAPPYSHSAYVKPYQPPMGPQGQHLVELQSPVARPMGGNGQEFHELG